jgi:hypothetical protein
MYTTHEVHNGSDNMSEVSVAHDPKTVARTSVIELTTELRHKFLTILKSCYWSFFEEGQCMA